MNLDTTPHVSKGTQSCSPNLAQKVIQAKVTCREKDHPMEANTKEKGRGKTKNEVGKRRFLGR